MVQKMNALSSDPGCGSFLSNAGSDSFYQTATIQGIRSMWAQGHRKEKSFGCS